MRHPIRTAAILGLALFAIVSLVIQGLTDSPAQRTERVCTHHASAWNTVYAKNSPEGYPPITYRVKRSWCDQWEQR